VHQDFNMSRMGPMIARSGFSARLLEDCKVGRLQGRRSFLIDMIWSILTGGTRGGRQAGVSARTDDRSTGVGEGTNTWSCEIRKRLAGNYASSMERESCRRLPRSLCTPYSVRPSLPFPATSLRVRSLACVGTPWLLWDEVGGWRVSM
jgi:hypothetical protein